MSDKKNERYRRIAVEEGFTIPEITQLRSGEWRQDGEPSAKRRQVFRNLLDLGEGRIKAMDEDGIAMQVCVLSGAVIQDIDPVQGNELAALSNDRLAEAAKKYPDRITGLAAYAPRDPERAARELERAVKKLGLKGGIVNSHAKGEYYDDQKFWPIFEAADAMGAPIYIHPRDPSPQMIGPFQVTGFKIGWSWAAEVGTHIIRLIGAGLFDRFPRLKIVIGHMGEGLPFHLDRIDNRYFWEHEMAGTAPKLKRRPSDYLRDNVVVTTSGMNFALPLKMTIAQIGIDNVLFAGDWPYEDVRQSVDACDALDLPDADMQKFYHQNSERVFRL
jgi:5-carboxyvanillate decarboxylase